MDQEYYLIKEAATKVGVESHVLRYWEEELKMDIHRNAMGHRYYTEKDIRILTKVKELKDRGLQLKAIRDYLEKRRKQIENDNDAKTDVICAVADDKPVKTYFENAVEEDLKRRETATKGKENVKVNEGQIVPVQRHETTQSIDKMEQFQQIMNRVLANAIRENNELIGKTAGEHAANAVVTEIRGMTKEQEARQEARYKKLDQTLREMQRARAEAAAANMRPADRRKQKRLKRKELQETKGTEVESEQLENVPDCAE